MNGRQAFGWFIVGALICGGWAYLASGKRTAPAASATTRPLIAREQIVGRWAYDQQIRTLGEPFRARVRVAFLPDGTLRQQVKVYRRDGTPTTQPAAVISGTWSLVGDDLKVSVGSHDFVLLPVASGDELDLIADSPDTDLSPDSTLRRDVAPEPLD